MNEKYAIGAEVEWTSQAQGHSATKRGTITAVIPANVNCRDCLGEPHRAAAKNWGLPRQEKSYVVHVPSASGRGGGKLYWPRTSSLRPAARSPEELKRDAAQEMYEALEELAEEFQALYAKQEPHQPHKPDDDIAAVPALMRARTALAHARGEA